jgi:ribosomal protein S27E
MTKWTCEDCQWEWPLSTDPPRTAECGSCGGWLEATQCGTCGQPCNRIAIMPRWEDDKTVIANGWLEGHCPECGNA